MKLSPTHLLFAIAVGVAPATTVMAGQQDVAVVEGGGQKARPGPIAETQQTKAQYDRVIGVCETAEVGGGGLSPIRALQNYFSIIEKKVITGPSSVTVLVMPKHGVLDDRGTKVNSGGKLVDSGVRHYSYYPQQGYLGEDQVVFMVELGGMKVKVVYSLHVTDISDDETEGIYCPTSFERLPNNNGGAASSQSFQFNFAQQGGAFET